MDPPRDLLAETSLDAGVRRQPPARHPVRRGAGAARAEMTGRHADGGESVLSAGNSITHSLFPFNGLMVSMLRELSGGRSVEVAAIGREGAVGGIISCGNAPAFTNRRWCNCPARRRWIPMPCWRRPRRPARTSATCSAATPMPAGAGHAVGRVQRLSPDRGARRALAAPRPGSRRQRPARTDAGKPCRAARRAADHRQRGRPGAPGAGADRLSPRRHPGHRPRRACTRSAAIATQRSRPFPRGARPGRRRGTPA
jgi:hypothetical protein